MNFLHYVENSSDEYVTHTGDVRIGQLHEKIRVLKQSRRWREQYMTFDELLRKSEKKGHDVGLAEGHAKGEQRLLNLISKMIENGESDAVSRLTKDADFLSQMYEKYHV